MLMKIKVLPFYDINSDTNAILAANHFDYNTIVWERGQCYYVKEKAFKMIERACIEGGAGYEGRRNSVVYKTKARNKVPIPINPKEDIYAFPTCSPSAHECSWIFYPHVKDIAPNGNNAAKTIITFKNHKQLVLDVSYNIIKRQMHLTSYCVVLFSPIPIDRPRLG